LPLTQFDEGRWCTTLTPAARYRFRMVVVLKTIGKLCPIVSFLSHLSGAVQQIEI
jgi:hypothetical protein